MQQLVDVQLDGVDVVVDLDCLVLSFGHTVPLPVVRVNQLLLGLLLLISHVFVLQLHSLQLRLLLSFGIVLIGGPLHALVALHD